MWQISYPPPPPENGVSQGNYFLPKSHKFVVFKKNSESASFGLFGNPTPLQKQLWQPKEQDSFKWFFVVVR